MTCQHVKYDSVALAARTVCDCRDCDASWMVHDGELRFADGIFGASALALLTSRDERTPAQNRVLGFA